MDNYVRVLYIEECSVALLIDRVVRGVRIPYFSVNVRISLDLHRQVSYYIVCVSDSEVTCQGLRNILSKCVIANARTTECG